MPRILMTSNPAEGAEQGAVMLRERVAVADFESPHFKAQLLERLGWAVGDAQDAEQRQQPSGRRHGRDRRTRDRRAPAGFRVG